MLFGFLTLCALVALCENKFRELPKKNKVSLKLKYNPDKLDNHIIYMKENPNSKNFLLTSSMRRR